jgi:hypothetical protein
MCGHLREIEGELANVLQKVPAQSEKWQVQFMVGTGKATSWKWSWPNVVDLLV